MDDVGPPRKLRKSYNTPGHSHELTFSTYQKRQLLALPGVAELFLEGLDRARGKLDFNLFAYVVMPDHCHVLVGPRQNAYDVGRILSQIKGPFAKMVLGTREDVRRLAEVGRLNGKLEHRIWERGGGYDRNVFTPQTVMNAVRYIHMNPVRGGLCAEPSEWPWSSAAVYAGGVAPIPIDNVDLGS